MSATLDELGRFVKTLSPAERCALHDEGLFFSFPAKSSGYDVTPTGYLMFASTGGDGVHFSLRNGTDSAKPVCMTVPMCFESPNLIVGESLYEFLCLGCISGFFTLEQLVYSRNRAAKEIEQARQQSTILLKLSHEFGLKPWRNVVRRLIELNQ